MERVWRCLPPSPAEDRSAARKLEEERRAGAAVGDDPDAAVHPRYELAGDVETEAGAADPARQVRVEAEELLEDTVLLGGRHAEALVADSEPDAAAAAAYLDLDLSAVGGVLDRVVGPVGGVLGQLVRVGGGRRQATRRGAAHDDLDSLGRP